MKVPQVLVVELVEDEVRVEMTEIRAEEGELIIIMTRVITGIIGMRRDMRVAVVRIIIA